MKSLSVAGLGSVIIKALLHPQLKREKSWENWDNRSPYLEVTNPKVKKTPTDDCTNLLTEPVGELVRRPEHSVPQGCTQPGTRSPGSSFNAFGELLPEEHAG